MGFDVHRRDPGSSRPLVLGGVEFPEEAALAGHSDADVVTHAIADALLGAAALGDLGQHFPDDDPAWRDADSLVLLGIVVGRVREAGWVPVNVDCSVALESPRLADHKERMQQRLGAVIGAGVSVKATRPERLGALGRGEGVACWAVALLAPE